METVIATVADIQDMISKERVDENEVGKNKGRHEYRTGNWAIEKDKLALSWNTLPQKEKKRTEPFSLRSKPM